MAEWHYNLILVPRESKQRINTRNDIVDNELWHFEWWNKQSTQSDNAKKIEQSLPNINWTNQLNYTHSFGKVDSNNILISTNCNGSIEHFHIRLNMDI